MVSEEARAKTRKARALATKTNSSTWPKMKFHQKQCGASVTKIERVL
jgi:hypothetical protein